MANYCTKQQAADLCGKAATDIADDWLDWIDAKIEEWSGAGYKGATRTRKVRGDGNSLIRLPSAADTITSITEDGVALSSGEYDHDPDVGGRFVERINNSTVSNIYGYSPQGAWTKGRRYIVTYEEPTTPPKQYELTAAQCVALIALWADKQRDFGLALTISDAGSAGRVSSAEANSFPANLLEEIGRTIQRGVRKTGI